MFSWAVIFLIIALVAAVLGFSGIAGTAANIAWILFVVGLIAAVIFFVSAAAVLLPCRNDWLAPTPNYELRAAGKWGQGFCVGRRRTGGRLAACGAVSLAGRSHFRAH